ncbi:MAG: hypothetical protein AMXMBFR84_16570 [Candidatus Hydrogenedentota bacterium]
MERDDYNAIFPDDDDSLYKNAGMELNANGAMKWIVEHINFAKTVDHRLQELRSILEVIWENPGSPENADRRWEVDSLLKELTEMVLPHFMMSVSDFDKLIPGADRAIRLEALQVRGEKNLNDTKRGPQLKGTVVPEEILSEVFNVYQEYRQRNPTASRNLALKYAHSFLYERAAKFDRFRAMPEVIAMLEKPRVSLKTLGRNIARLESKDLGHC